MTIVVALLALSLTASVANAQAGRDARSDGADARTDALLGTPNRITPVPQTNRFSTSPGLGQQAPGPFGQDQSQTPGVPGPPNVPAAKRP